MGRSPLSESFHMVSSPFHSLAVRLVKNSIGNTESIRKPSSRSSARRNSNNSDPTDGRGFFDAPLDSSDREYETVTESKDDLHASLRTPPPRPEVIRRAHTTGTNEISPSSSSSGKSVAFGDIHTRSYSLVLGDHPCCSMGCPLSLGWEYKPVPDISLDEYEATRCPRRSKTEMLTTWQERRDMLADVPDDEVKRAQRKFHRERCNQRKVQTRVCAAFFQEPADARNATSCT